jgi:fluoroacetyl-CoA thioesterase
MYFTYGLAVDTLRPKPRRIDRMSALLPGLRHTLTMTVDERLLVPAVFPDAPLFRAMPPVFATAFMVGLMELACVEALSAHLPAHQRTVGTHVDVSHCAATPLGLTVSADVVLEEVHGRRLWFRVAARDEVEVIGEGRHQRAIVDADRFLASVRRKAPPLPVV